MDIFQNEAESFERRMRDIVLTYEDDEEVRHEKMDQLMCETLERFGCYAGVEIFRDTSKWYA